MTKKHDKPTPPRDIAPPKAHEQRISEAFAELAETASRVGRHMEVHEKLPPGFNCYRGKGSRFKADAVLELAIRVRPVGSEAKDAAEAHVIMIAGPRRVHASEWDIPASEFGSIAGTKLVPPESPQ
jgi:hypothetical protein